MCVSDDMLSSAGSGQIYDPRARCPKCPALMHLYVRPTCVIETCESCRYIEHFQRIVIGD